MTRTLLWRLMLTLFLLAAAGCSGEDDDDDASSGDDDSSEEPGDDDSTGDDDDASSGDDDSPGDDDDASSATDGDGDGYAGPGGSGPVDCDDADASVYPGAPERCDGEDNDCDEAVDEDAEDPAWPDVDEDGYGDAEADPAIGCDPPAGYVREGGDCDDADPAVNPGEIEACDGEDDNCDGTADEGLNSRTWYPDADGDGYGAATGGVIACERPDGYATNDDDCDDADPATNPLKAERCDGRDNNCDGTADEGLHLERYYLDQDQDGYGDPAEPLISCGVSAGIADNGTDCDDETPDRHPNAAERCDGVDQDCDGLWDEGRTGQEGTTAWYRDADGDGFGIEGEVVYGCTKPSGYSADRGDCDDTKAAVRPGADDAAGDGIDQDCGGSAGPEPHVGLSVSSAASIQAALSAASAGAKVWVGPGTWLEHDLTFNGRTLIATRPGAAVVDAGGLGSAFRFASKEGADTVLDGFTVKNGRAKKGGGVFIDGASPTLRKLTVIDSFADESGGGLYLNASSAALIDLVVARNRVSNTYTTMTGGGITLAGSTVTLTGAVVRDNQANDGGGLYVQSSSLTLSDALIAHNRASIGGGLSFPFVLNKSFPTSLTRCRILDNRANDGAGIALRVAGLTMASCSILGNRAREHGGGIYVTTGNPSIVNSTFAGNRALTGGGLEITGASTTATLQNVISAYNDGYNLFVQEAAVALTYTDLYSPVGPNHNLSTLPATNLTTDPGFIAFNLNPTPYDDDDHLASSSPMRNKGDPATSNPDGAQADLGAYGGLEADRSYYLDSDGDGMYNGWESPHGLDPKTVDGVKDPDADGATNAREFFGGSDPQVADTDGDGAKDGAESNGGTDPADWYSQPGVVGVALADVPGDFDSLQAAIDAIQARGRIQLGAGDRDENVFVDSRDLVLTVSGSSLATIQAPTGTVLSARWSKLELSGLALDGGLNDFGGAIFLHRTAATVSGLEITGGRAGHGGAIYADLSELTLSDAVLSGACADADFGGMLELVASTATLTGAEVTGGVCSNGADVDGLVLQGSEATVVDSVFSSHSGVGVNLVQKSRASFTGVEVSSNKKGGVAVSDSPELAFTGCRIVGNTGGTGLYLYNTDPEVTDCTIADNVSSVEGGGVYLFDSRAKLTGCVIRGNTGKSGGGVFIESSRPTVDRCTITGNSAAKGGGMYLLDAEDAVVSSSRVAENSATTGGGLYLEASLSTLRNLAVESNHADAGGGIYFVDAADAQLRAVSVRGNDADYGGGIYVDDSSPTLIQCVVVGNDAVSGGGVSVNGTDGGSIRNSILAYNAGYNLYVNRTEGTPSVTWTDLYALPGEENHNLESPDSSILTVEPGFLVYADAAGAACTPGGAGCLPSDLHLAKASALVNAGDPSEQDVDLSRADLGIYGGGDGDDWDLDGDQVPDWFWPGTIHDAPAGFLPGDYDCDDGDPSAPMVTCPN